MSPIKSDGPARHGSRDSASHSIAIGVALAVTVACSATSPSKPDQWRSDQASLSLSDTTSTLLILASGDCVGSYGDFNGDIPSGHFDIPGTYTQLTGVYPGKIDYPAQFSGSRAASAISITVTVPALQSSFGPFTLAPGALPDWQQCLYP